MENLNFTQMDFVLFRVFITFTKFYEIEIGLKIEYFHIKFLCPLKAYKTRGTAFSHKEERLNK